MKYLWYAICLLGALGFGILLGQHSRHLHAISGKPDPTHTATGINIDARTRQLLGIQLATVQQTTTAGRLRVSGRVAAEDSRVYQLNIGADGVVKETNDDGVGSYVRKDQRLAVIYAPQFLSVAGGYLSAYQRTQGNKEGAPGTDGYASPQTWSDRLRNLGMSDPQIKELASTRKVPEVVYISAPVDGFIVARNISAGMTFEPFTEFYRIADLSHVWIFADIFSSEASYFRTGQTGGVTLPGRGKTYEAKITDVLPQVNTANRALQLRLEADNKDFILRPDMIVDVELKVPAPKGLSVPADAVLESGNSERVFVERRDGWFEPREVETGQHFADRVQILKGLTAGEKVVASGIFLVDSETRLRHPSSRWVARKD